MQNANANVYTLDICKHFIVLPLIAHYHDWQIVECTNLSINARAQVSLLKHCQVLHGQGSSNDARKGVNKRLNMRVRGRPKQ
jgi:hypothetical protein